MNRPLVLVLAAALVAGACGDDSDSSGPVTLTLVTHDSFAVSDDVLAAFTADTGIEVELAKGGDAGQVLNRAILTKGKPEGDVLFGVDNTLLSRAVREEVFLPYESPELDQVDPAFRDLAPAGVATPIDHGDVCVNYDVAWFEERSLDPPRTLDDLADPRYRDLLVVQNPATSSPGLAFLLATVARYGDGGWRNYWQRLADNGVEVVDGWTTAYNVRFSGSAGNGPKPLVVSYGSSPPAEVLFATDPKPSEAPTGVVEDTCFQQVEFAAVLDGTDHEAEARQLIDFLLSPTFQADMPLNMFVYPVRQGVALPEEFERFAVVPDEPLSLPPDEIDAGRERWIDEWTNVVLG